MKKKKEKREKTLKLKSSNQNVSIYSNSIGVFNRKVESIEVIVEPMNSNEYEKLYESFNRVYLKYTNLLETDNIKTSANSGFKKLGV